ncbi:hypothetical protein SAY86_009434 [Trapa natans]|uniref:Uncharacterized protein n=1 Tax=Trapa natans TaxID=22666 RepID=A0AAN7QPT1_TRANT|nr:hypothetical protein SAY86_009434 [Trapa natans]
MAQHTVDPKSVEPRHGNREPDLPCSDKNLLITTKKKALRELQNDNRIIAPSSTKSLSSFKDSIPVYYPTKVAGTKRPLPPSELSVSPLRNLSSGSNSPNSQLVYMRRKSETEPAKGVLGDLIHTSPNNLQSSAMDAQQEKPKLQSQLKEPRLVYHPAFVSMPYTSPIGSSRKPLNPFPLGVPVVKMESSEEPKHGTGASAGLLMENSKRIKNLHWEERYEQLQKLLSDLDQADHKIYLQMLHSLSSADLSTRAVELEKRSIQLSLEEAKEMQRVAMLNVLRKP